jgi:hypothetical protein
VLVACLREETFLKTSGRGASRTSSGIHRAWKSEGSLRHEGQDGGSRSKGELHFGVVYGFFGAVKEAVANFEDDVNSLCLCNRDCGLLKKRDEFHGICGPLLYFLFLC